MTEKEAVVVGVSESYVNSTSSQWMVSSNSFAFTLVTLPSMLNWQTNLLWIMNWATWSTFTLIDFRCPKDTRISFPFRISVPLDTLGQKAGPERILGPMRLMPVTRMSFLQFSAVPWVQWCLSTHQSQGNSEETQVVHELYVLQSKKVKLVTARSRPSSPARIDS